MTHQVYLEKPLDSMSPMHTNLFACEKVRNLQKLFNCPTLKVAYIRGQLETTIDHSSSYRKIYTTKQGSIKGDDPDGCFQVLS